MFFPLPRSLFRRLGILALLSGTLWAGESADCPASDSAGVIRSIELEGLRTTRREVVYRELGHRAGAPFDCAEWERERTRLEDLDIFAEIRVRSDTGRLVYTFRELPPYIPFVSILLTDQDGFSMGPALASFNFLGRDIRLEAMARFGGTTELLAAVSSPWLGNLPLEYDLALIRVDSYNDFEDFHEDSWRLKLDLQQRLRGRSEILYLGELFWMDATGAPPGTDPTLSPGADFLPRLGLGYLWDGRDRRHNPRAGVYQEVRLTQNGGWLGGDADYLEWLSDTRAYLPWLGRNVLHVAGLYRYRTGEVGTSFPIYDRFHTGGVNSLRGFRRDAFRGRSEWVGTLENRTDLLKKRNFTLWKWGGYFGLQGVIGLEAASLWGHDDLLEGGAEVGLFGGLHLLVAGVDKVRLEGGSNTARLRFEWGLGILEKADAQRFRAR